MVVGCLRQELLGSLLQLPGGEHAGEPAHQVLGAGETGGVGHRLLLHGPSIERVFVVHMGTIAWSVG